MNTIKQIFFLAAVFVRSIPARKGTSLVVVAGIGGVVAVLVSLFALANGFSKTMQQTGKTDRVLLLRAGSTSEINGNIDLEQFDVVKDFSNVARAGEEPVAVRETYVTVNMPEKSTGETSSLPMRGTSEAAFRVRREASLVAGRMFSPGKYELIAGAGAVRQFAGLEIGQSIRIRGVDWLVTGHFQADGGAYASEVWVDERVLAQSWSRGAKFSSALLQLKSRGAFDDFIQAVESDRRLTFSVFRESEYYAKQASGTSDLMKGVGILVAIIMSLGAVLSCLNTMFVALATRGGEVSTYRALGFRRLPIVVAVLFETVLLGVVGAVVGIGAAMILFDGMTFSTVAATSTAFSQVAFQFAVTGDIVLVGLVVASFLAVISGLIPAVSAARRSIVDGLRHV